MFSSLILIGLHFDCCADAKPNILRCVIDEYVSAGTLMPICLLLHPIYLAREAPSGECTFWCVRPVSGLMMLTSGRAKTKTLAIDKLATAGRVLDQHCVHADRSASGS